MSSQQVTLVFNAILDIQNHESLDEGQLLPALLQRPLTDRDLIHSFAQVLLSACNRTHTDRRNSHIKLPELLSDQDSPVDEKRNTKKARVQKEVRVMPQLATPDPEPELQSSMVSPSNMNSSSDQRDHDGEHTAESDLSPRDPDIIAQSIDDFIQESQDEISYFSSAENSERTYQILSALIDGDAVLGDEPQEEARWTDGAEWLSLLESGRKDRKKGTICYAITAVAFARWHATQVRLLGDEVTSQQASQQVSARILDSHTDGDTKRREKQRKKLNTHLARGRKWLRLVDALGMGILFRKAWKLAKSPESVINVIVDKMPDDEKKMIVLRLLGDQIKLLLQTGRTNTDTFCNGLKMPELASPQATFTTSFTQLQEIQTSITGSELVVKSTEYRFPITSLHLLDGSQWINQDIILACLHLADRLPFIRVSSFHVALSDQLKDPLQMTRKTVRQWRQEIKKEEHLVSFFPLNHGGSHWSLLEIDDREQRITLYNGSEDYIKDACKKAFPNHKFVYGETTPQKDGYNCGPLVIHYARRRMLGRSVLEEYNEREIRAEAVRLLHTAWTHGELQTATMPQKRKRKTEPECSSSDECSPKDIIELSD
ncbi:hypothetical protein FOVG_19607 [Fusarium oxysporum f. sp. pisi HDV247]|uniref:Ubiquitin-like protease family profile domain-containing protein n=1 Tax=Fusarium oxysporum f. sp. pisi HDV247 TaxID=1080344 RepID=W9N848_FUSOX|nr:hypothetical protein FOVG_19607 [Fusarium oxysporum f. sp. pisi HDV247]